MSRSLIYLFACLLLFSAQYANCEETDIDQEIDQEITPGSDDYVYPSLSLLEKTAIGLAKAAGWIGDIGGKIGDKIGDTWGKIGDIGGKIGDIGGKIDDKIGGIGGGIRGIFGRAMKSEDNETEDNKTEVKKSITQRILDNIPEIRAIFPGNSELLISYE